MTATRTTQSPSARIRARLDHPVIDGDGHWLEPLPLFVEYLREVGSPKMVEQFETVTREFLGGWYSMTPQERLDTRSMRPPFWGETPAANTLDRATAMLPNLLRERLDDFGIDFAVIYPTMGFLGVRMPGERFDELRRAIVRATNVMAADLFRPHADRMTPAAIIGAATPEEAIEEAEFAVHELGMKVIAIAGNERRPIPALAREVAEPAKAGYYIDPLALDSPHDYDPFWAKCIELNLAVTDHGGGAGWPDRLSPSNFVFNHIGHFAAAHHAFCKALVLGGVAHRFPNLKFCFLEGGIGYGHNLYLDMVVHWEKRNKQALLSSLRPDNLDLGQLRTLVDQYGDPRLKDRYEDLVGGSLSQLSPFTSLEELCSRETDIDEFAASGIHSANDISRLFEQNFYFGCEADDKTTAWAFDKRMGARLNPVFSSDIGHFDVTDMTEVLHEAYELVEGELIGPGDFKRFVFSNIAELQTAMNPEFFKGTVVEEAVEQL